MLKALPDRPEADKPKARQPKAARGGFKPKASSQPKAENATEARLAKLEALLLQLAEGQFRQEPAKPVAPSGHSKKPAKPEVVKLAEGQIVEWDGKLVELTRQANGRIGQRSVG